MAISVGRGGWEKVLQRIGSSIVVIYVYDEIIN